MAGLPGPEPAGDITPRPAGVQLPQDAAHHLAVAAPWLARRLLAGSNRCTRLKAESVSSNIALLLGSWTIQERDPIGQHRQQQQSAAAVLGGWCFS
jgi:hypothetical protein